MKKKRIVITGGVLTPAMAVISELQKQREWEIYFLGRRYAMEGEKIPSMESKMIPQLGVKFISISTGRLQRRFTPHTIPSLLRIPLGFFQSLIVLSQIRPQVICAFGGYVSVPVVLAGWLLRIPILVHEQTVVSGLANRINALFANKIAVSFSESLSHFSKGKVVLTGNPIRKEVFQVQKPSWFQLRAAGKAFGDARPASSFAPPAKPLATPGQLPIIYITGGNQGSHPINMAVVEILPRLLEKYLVIHQTGEKDYSHISHITYHISPQLKKHYFVFPYIGPRDIGWVLNKASLIVSRAGANTVCEIAALGKPTIFIPIPWSYKDEQTKNAQMLEKAGIAQILPQKDLNGNNLFLKISKMMNTLNEYRKNIPRAQKLIRLDAASQLVETITQLAQ